jgi:hypothetical protein
MHNVAQMGILQLQDRIHGIGAALNSHKTHINTAK